MEDFFTVSEADLEMKRSKVRVNKKGNKVKFVETYVSRKRICHVANTSEYIMHLIKLRGLDPAKTLVRLGLDGGGGSLKILVSVFQPTSTGGASQSWIDMENDDEWIIEGRLASC